MHQTQIVKIVGMSSASLLFIMLLLEIRAIRTQQIDLVKDLQVVREQVDELHACSRTGE